MVKLGIIGAMQQEIETLLSELRDPVESRHAGSTFYEGILEGTGVVIVKCGVGKVNAAICAQILCDCYGVTHIVNTGIAGSLCPELDIGDIVISQDAMHHDVDAAVFGYPAGTVPGMPDVYPADERLIAYAQDAIQTVHPGHGRTGRVASGDQFVSNREMKARIIAVTNALCTEMEGASIAQTAYRNGIPYLILRAISDKADDSAEMDYPAFELLAAHRCAAVTRILAQKLSADIV